jgi:hypothetical protein
MKKNREQTLKMKEERHRENVDKRGKDGNKSK